MTRLVDLIDAELLDRGVDRYRLLHSTPELSGQEHETARFIEGELLGFGYEVFRCAGTGVVGVLRNGPGRTVAYRADIDALPLEERTGVPYASTAQGVLADGTPVPVMHACGHDMHTAVALSAAELLAGHRDAWTGTVVFVFQPAEESGAGARQMVEDGLWDRAPLPDVLLAQHVRAIASDEVQIGSGDVMTLADSWKVTFLGRAAHASKPEDSIDAVVLAAHAIVRLQSIVSREVSPRASAVVTVGTVQAGVAHNIIPERAVITLNVRTISPADRDRVLAAVRRVVEAEAAASGAAPPLIEQLISFPRCFNDPVESDLVADALAAEFGADKLTRDFRAPASEDVGWLVEGYGIPLVYSFFGAYRDAAGGMPPNHTQHFAPHAETSLGTGTRAALTAIGTQLQPR